MLEDRLGGVSIMPEMYQNGHWIALAAELLSCPKPVAALANGADLIAEFLGKLI